MYRISFSTAILLKQSLIRQAVCRQTKWAFLGERLEESAGPRMPGDRSVDFLAPQERCSFESFAPAMCGLSSPILSGWCYLQRIHWVKGRRTE
jgi:hypothetical protein